MKQLKVSIAIVGTLVLGACGNDDSRGGDYSTPSKAFAALVKGFCERAIECKDSAPDEADFQSAAECEAALDAFLGAEFEAQDASAAAGRITWSAADAEFCAESAIDVFNGGTCEQFWDEGLDAEPGDARCDALGQGTVANGGACTIDDDCATEGSNCVNDTCQAAV